jgi:hypothetical protein
MKILLVNNHTDYLHNVQAALAGHNVEVQEFKPGLKFNHEDKDLVVLSGGGGEGFELKDKFRGKLWYEDEMSFVLSNLSGIATAYPKYHPSTSKCWPIQPPASR